MAVTLDVHEFGHEHAAKLRYPSDIVPRQVNQHDVLGSFLRIGEELDRVGFILLRSVAARARSGNGSNFDDIAEKAHVQFGRAANKGEVIAEAKAEHVGRGVDETETAIQVERLAIEIGFEALRQHHLEDIAGS